MKKIAVIHYDEISLKGDNRPYFEQKLGRNVSLALGSDFYTEIKWGGRMFVQSKEEWLDKYDERVLKVLSQTPGVATYGLGYVTSQNFEAISEATSAVVKAQEGLFETFRISTSRADKDFAMSSLEMDKELGGVVLTAIPKSKVSLKNFDINIRVVVHIKEAYVYIKKTGVGGLPVGSLGKGVVLISGGFDSPVATFMAAKRGVKPFLLHFHAHPQTSLAAIDKVRDLAQALSPFTGELTLALAPILQAQKSISMNSPEKLRVILYRRLMMRVAEKWAESVGAKALITGDAIGQVASQTLENIAAISEATSLPVLRPLCGFNKNEIINLARTIGTHDISVLPHDDTCTVFMPQKPETRAVLKEVLKAEESLDMEALALDILSKIEIEKINRE